MRSYAAFAALAAAVAALPARAQEPPAGAVDAGAAEPGSTALAGADLNAHDTALKAQIVKELQAQEDAKLQKMRDELKDEIRAEMTTAQAPPQEFEELPEEKPKLQFLELDGYFRVRPTLFQNMQLGWTQPDPQGYYFFPKSYSNPNSKTVESTDTRLRVEPTLNISEDIRIRAQIDVLDNLVFGSTPQLSTSTPLTVLSQSQVPPSSLAQNLQNDSFRAKRVWAEVRLPPIGELRFGRMGNQWGMGMYQNDGNCLDCDYGNTVDRIALVLKLANHYIIPMIDWVGAGALYNTFAGDQLGQPVAFDRLLEAYQYGIQLVRRDSEKELKALEEQGKASFNYGFYGTIRQQDHDLVGNGAGGYGQVSSSIGGCTAPGGAGTQLTANPNSACFNGANVQGVTVNGVDARNATFYVPDVWLRYKTRRARLEGEFVYVNGSYTINAEDSTGVISGAIDNVDHQINMSSFGGAVESEYKFLNDLQLAVGLDVGLATGNNSYGFGAQPGRTSPFGSRTGGTTSQGSIDGNPILCTNNTEPCERSNINAFSFSPDFRIDELLWRQLIGTVTDAFYLKPTFKYRFLPGFEGVVAGIYSQSMRPSGTPGQQAPLGLEGDVGLHYQTDDGFVATIDYGVLLPLSGLSDVSPNGIIGTSVAQSIRLLLAVKY